MTSFRLLWLLLALLWFGIEVALARKHKADARKVLITELESRRLLWLTVVISATFALVLKTLAWTPLPLQYESRQFVALALFTAGLSLRYAAVIKLGRFFSTHVILLKEHRLITDGPFRLIRHPTYTGLLVALAAAGLAMGDLLSLLLLTVPALIAFNFRVGIEERLMIEQFGQDYRNYRKTTRKFLPWLY